MTDFKWNDLAARKRSSNMAEATVTSLMRTHRRAHHTQRFARTHMREAMPCHMVADPASSGMQTAVHDLALTARRAAFTASSIANEYE